MDKNKENINLDVLRNTYGRVQYTQTTHEYEVQNLSDKITRIKWANVVSTALTFSSIASVVVFDEKILEIIAALLSMVSIGLSIYQLSFNPEQEKVGHQIAAKELWYIREKYKHLIADIMKGNITEEKVLTRRDSLLEELKIVYKFSPNTSNKAYKQAQKALQIEEEQSFSVEELDNLLPDSLGLSKNTTNETSN